MSKFPSPQTPQVRQFASQEEPGFPFSAPLSQLSPSSILPFPQTGSGWQVAEQPEFHAPLSGPKSQPSPLSTFPSPHVEHFLQSEVQPEPSFPLRSFPRSHYIHVNKASEISEEESAYLFTIINLSISTISTCFALSAAPRTGFSIEIFAEVALKIVSRRSRNAAEKTDLLAIVYVSVATIRGRASVTICSASRSGSAIFITQIALVIISLPVITREPRARSIKSNSGSGD